MQQGKNKNGDLRLDNTTPPKASSGSGFAGTSFRAAPADHVHPQMTTSKAFAQDHTVVVLLPAGTITSASEMTLGTALPVRPLGVCKAYISPGFGMPEGLYAVTFPDTTHVVFSGSPSLTPGPYTPETNVEKVLASFTLPGGTLGLHGCAYSTTVWLINNSAGSKTVYSRLGASAFLTAANTTANLYLADTRMIRVSGSQSVQQASALNAPLGGYGGTTNLPMFLAENTASDLTVSYRAKLATGATTDLIMLMGYSFEVVLSPLG